MKQFAFSFVKLSMFRPHLWFIFALLPVFFIGAARAQDESDLGNKLVHTKLVFDTYTIQASSDEATRSARVGVLFEIEPGWHIYWKNSGEAAIPTTVDFSLPSGWRAGELAWPVPYRFIERGGIVTFGFENSVLLVADLFAPQVVSASDQKATISAQIDWLVCKEICVPGSRAVSAQVELSLNGALKTSDEISYFREIEPKLPKTLDALRKDPPWKSFAVTVSRVNLPAKGDGAIQIVLRNTPPILNKNVSDFIQFFPANHDYIAYKRSLGYLRTGPKTMHMQPEIILEVPVTISAHKEEMQTQVGGVITFAPGLFGQAEERAFEWHETINSVAAKETSEVSESTPEAKALSYRVISHETPSTTPAAESGSPIPPGAATSFLPALVSAFIAGLILNFMPCVLPVLSLKVMSLVSDRKKGFRARLSSALAFSFGIIASMLLLATIIVVLKQAGLQTGWGFQFQYPGFVASMALIVFILSLGFFDFYTLALPGLNSANALVLKLEGSFVKNFFEGVLVTALSTPCTAPFLGTALTFALAQSPYIIFIIFATIGIGLSLPFLVLTLLPESLNFFPKPGAWMERMKQFLGFFLVGTVIWLLSVLAALNAGAVIPTLIILFSSFFALWLPRAFVDSERFQRRRPIIRAITFLVILSIIASNVQAILKRPDERALDSGTGISWQPYSKELVDRAWGEGKIAFLDFTAEWCITCKFNERLVLSSDSVARLFKTNDVIAMKGDWTRGDPEISKILKQYGSEGVPLYVVIAPGKPGRVLPTILTTGIIEDAILQAAREMDTGKPI